MKRTMRIAITTVATLGLVATIPATAFAGEITGTGKPTPVARPTVIAASACAYSGLEDDPNSPLRTQTPHEVYVTPPEFPFTAVINPPPGTPGTACNPTAGG